MNYKVHRLDVKRDTMQIVLETYLNQLHGEVVSIIPDVRPAFRPMGGTAITDFLLIVEKVG